MRRDQVADVCCRPLSDENDADVFSGAGVLEEGGLDLGDGGFCVVLGQLIEVRNGREGSGGERRRYEGGKEVEAEKVNKATLTVRDDEEVGLPAQVNVPDPGEQEARDGVLENGMEFRGVFGEEEKRLNKVEVFLEGILRLERNTPLSSLYLFLSLQSWEPPRLSPRPR